jgi:hypothetical protein
VRTIGRGALSCWLAGRSANAGSKSRDDVGLQVFVRHCRSPDIHIQARGLDDPAHEGDRLPVRPAPGVALGREKAGCLELLQVL